MMEFWGSSKQKIKYLVADVDHEVIIWEVTKEVNDAFLRCLCTTKSFSTLSNLALYTNLDSALAYGDYIDGYKGMKWYSEEGVWDWDEVKDE